MSTESKEPKDWTLLKIIGPTVLTGFGTHFLQRQVVGETRGWITLIALLSVLVTGIYFLGRKTLKAESKNT